MTYTDILFNINNDNNPEYIKMNQITKIDIIDWSYFTWYMIFSIRKGITSKKTKNGVTVHNNDRTKNVDVSFVI